jgi:hypothetical protein
MPNLNASNRPLKTGLVAGADCLIGDASQWRGTRLCGKLLLAENEKPGAGYRECWSSVINLWGKPRLQEFLPQISFTEERRSRHLLFIFSHVMRPRELEPPCFFLGGGARGS